MSVDRKREPPEAWEALEKMSLEDEAERLAGMSDAELDQELAAAGFDPNAVRERGAELARKHAAISAPQPPPPVPLPATRVRRGFFSSPRAVVLLAAAVSALMSAALSVPVAMFVAREATEPVVTAPSPSRVAAELRSGAFDACKDARWVECLYELDRARAEDPLGDQDMRVQAARKSAMTALAQGVH